VTWLDEIDLSLPGESDERPRHGRPRSHRPRHRARQKASFLSGVITDDHVRRAAWAVLALSLAVFLLRGVDRVRRPVLVPSDKAAPSIRVPGFDEVAFQVTPASGLPGSKRHCALLASTTPQRDKGLMFRRDLAGYDGVIFQWTSPSRDQFWMKDTLLPLSIAWFDESGRFISATDMAPCPANANCPLYGAARQYTVAIEVIKGGLAGLGIGPNSTIAMGGSCS
jgi:uncharacterized membrane protein (UPF0127 family)